MRHPSKAIAFLALAIAVSACDGREQEDSVKEPNVETPTAEVAAGEATPAPTGTPPAAFFQCRSCHSVEPGKNGIGPTLAGIFGQKAGDVPGFAFSNALQESGITWDRATLDQWLAGPTKLVPGTRMVIGVPDPVRRKEIIDYLETLK